MERKASEALDRFLAACSTANWPEPLWDATLAFFRSRGVDSLCYHHLPPLGAPDEDRIRVVSHGWPDALTGRYVKSKLFRTDPLQAQAMASAEPFLWSEIRSLRPLSDAEARTLAILESAVKGEGLAVPAFGPGGRNGYFGLGLPQGSPPPAAARLWQAVCAASHIRYCRILMASLPVPPALSERERELLQWVARGKSNSVIAEIMQISPHTVDAYLRRVFHKLGTTDRITAAIRALGSGMIRGY